MITKHTIYRVLYFINGMRPSQEEQEIGATFGPHCAYRNVQFLGEDTAVEQCDAIYGAAPRKYVERFPVAVPISDYYAGKLGQAAPAAPVGGLGAAPAGDVPADPFLAAGAAPVKRTGKVKAPPAWTPNG